MPVALTRLLPRPALALALASALALCLAVPVLAVVQFNYYVVEAYPTLVLLKWSTASESDVAGFEALQKPAAAADAAYQAIAFVPARGDSDVGAVYELPVLDLTPGTVYCFRLRAVTSSGAPGELLDRCGYGPGVTPTPGGPTPVFTPATTPPPGPTASSPAHLTPKPKPVPIPEPFTLLLFGLGLAGLGVSVARRRKG